MSRMQVKASMRLPSDPISRAGVAAWSAVAALAAALVPVAAAAGHAAAVVVFAAVAVTGVATAGMILKS